MTSGGQRERDDDRGSDDQNERQATDGSTPTTYGRRGSASRPSLRPAAAMRS